MLWDELCLSPDNVLSLILVPPTLGKPVLADLHSGHLGIEKMKSLSRLTCWWPEINGDITAFARECSSCLHKIYSTPSQWTPWPMTFQPWQPVHIDFCGPFLDKYHAFIISDTYSKWPEVFVTHTANSTFVITALRKCFSREVIPQVLVSDNGTPFTSRETMTWLRSIGCRQVFSSPRHPVSNGAAENAVKSLKNAIYSARPNNLEELERTIDNYLLQYRNATHCVTKTSPAMLFKGRHLEPN